MRKFVKTILAGAVGLSMIAGVSAQTAGQTEDATISITANGADNILTIFISGEDFGAIEYSFDQRTESANFAVRVEDNRGTRNGWSVNIRAEGHLEGENTDEFIPLENLSLGAGTGGDIAEPDGPIGQPADPILRTPASPVTTDDQIILVAPAGEGAGIYEFTVPGPLVVPGGQVVDTYSTTLTVSIPAAPDTGD